MKLNGSRGTESYRALILDRFIYGGAIESCPQQRDLDRSNSYQVSIKQTESFSMDREAIEANSQKLRWIEIALTSVEKGRSKILIDSLAIERCREVQKHFFKEEKNIDMNAIKHATQPKIQSTF